MKVVVFSPFGLWNPHFETDLELAEKHLLEGDEVTWFGCEADLETCEPNPEHRTDRCLKCTGRQDAGLRLLSGRVRRTRHVDHMTDEDRARVAAFPARYASLDEVRALELGAFDLGWAALSTLFWSLGSIDLDARKHETWIAAAVRSSAAVYLGVRNYLAAHPTDRVYVFNGRMSSMRAVLRACQEHGVSCHVHERGADIGRYQITVDCMGHELEPYEARVRAAWAAPDPSREAKVEAADAWYARRAKGDIGIWYSYTDTQRADSLPAGWDDARHNIAVYTSSEFEYASISSEFKSPIFHGTAAEGLRDLMTRCAAEDPGVHFHVRMHPNPRSRGSSDVALLRAVDLPNATIIPPESDLSTYALMHASDQVLTTGSTIGIEAAYAGKPTILAGRSTWDRLGSVYTPQTMDELVALVCNRELPALDREGTLMFGYYLATLGIPYEHYEPSALMHGTFKGVKVRPPLGHRIRARLARLRHGRKGTIPTP